MCCGGCSMLLQIHTPAEFETGNVKAYFSGHYQDYGINVQAACDSKCRFVYAALAAPGGSNDIAAFRKLSLAQQIEKLPIGKYVIADNVYVCTEHLLTPFPGDHKKDASNDAYNFYLSQVHIQIEMTFARLVNKWRIFRRPLQVRLKMLVVFFCAQHGFIIIVSMKGQWTITTSTVVHKAVWCKKKNMGWVFSLQLLRWLRFKGTR